MEFFLLAPGMVRLAHLCGGARAPEGGRAPTRGGGSAGRGRGGGERTQVGNPYNFDSLFFPP